MSPQWSAPWHNMTNTTATNTTSYEDQDLDFMDLYDYQGALLFVVGLLCVYGVAILFLIISLIRKSRTELELVDHLRDFEAMRRASKRRIREQLSQRDSPSPDAGSRARRTVSIGGASLVDSLPQRRNPAVLRLMRAQTAVDIPEDTTSDDVTPPFTPRSILRQTTTLTPPRSPPGATCDIRLANISQPEVHKPPSCVGLNGGFLHDCHDGLSRMKAYADGSLSTLHTSRDSYLMPISETAQLNMEDDDMYSPTPIYV